MAEQDTGQQGYQQSTARRPEDAGRMGQIVRSRDLNTMLVIVLAALGIMLGAGPDCGYQCPAGKAPADQPQRYFRCAQRAAHVL